MNKSELESLVLATLHRAGDPQAQAQVTSWVDRASERISRDMRLRENTTTATLTGPTDGAFSLPADFAEAIAASVAVSRGRIPLSPIGQNEYQQWQVVQTDVAANVYTILDGQLQTWPPVSDEVQLSYYNKVALPDSASTNAILEAYSQLYLAAAMVFAKQWEENLEGQAYWQAEYDNEAATINDARRQQRQPQGRSEYNYTGGTIAV